MKILFKILTLLISFKAISQEIAFKKLEEQNIIYTTKRLSVSYTIMKVQEKEPSYYLMISSKYEHSSKDKEYQKFKQSYPDYTFKFLNIGDNPEIDFFQGMAKINLTFPSISKTYSASMSQRANGPAIEAAIELTSDEVKKLKENPSQMFTIENNNFNTVYNEPKKTLIHFLAKSTCSEIFSNSNSALDVFNNFFKILSTFDQSTRASKNAYENLATNLADACIGIDEGVQINSFKDLIDMKLHQKTPDTDIKGFHEEFRQVKFSAPLGFYIEESKR